MKLQTRHTRGAVTGAFFAWPETDQVLAGYLSHQKLKHHYRANVSIVCQVFQRTAVHLRHKPSMNLISGITVGCFQAAKAAMAMLRGAHTPRFL